MTSSGATTPASYPKRLIEVDLPIARISAHARREKSIRHGHISTLHIWWARRPLAACRAVICAALWPDPADLLCPQPFRDAATKHLVAFARRVFPRRITQEKEHLQATASPESLTRWEVLAKNDPPLDPADPDHQNVLRFALLDFIADFANWDNSTVPAYVETARALTEAAHEALGGEKGTRPLVVDPFAGGGSIPLEALRVGADAFASDLNPVAVLLNKVAIEYIPKYGQRLADEVRKWGQWVKEQAEKELAEFYPMDPDGSTPIAYLWARTIRCEGAGCGAEVPLIRSLWLAKKARRSVALKLVLNAGEKRVEFEIITDVKASEVGRGTSKGGSATCPLCGHTTPVESVRRQLVTRKGGSGDARLIAIVTNRPNRSGQHFRVPIPRDTSAFHLAEAELKHRESQTLGRLTLVPDEPINHLRGFFNIVLYGIDRWGALFSPRQALTISTFARLVRELPAEPNCKNGPFFDAVRTCLALIVDRVAVRCTANCIWDATTGCIMQLFNQGQSLPARWEFAEMSPCIDSGSGWSTSVDYTLKVLEHVASIPTSGQVVRASATGHPLPSESVDAFVTDPPYYSAVPYADLSDFFFAWLKRSLTGLHLDLFDTEVTEKKDELVTLSHRAAMYREKDSNWFEQRMGAACAEGRRICKASGLAVVVFANKETAAWEAMLAALIGADWIVTASWPIDTESTNRLRAKESAALASSVHLVCRPRAGGGIGDWRDVLSELPDRMHEWMPRLASEGVVGADAIFACLGPALEIYSRYARVEKASGEPVPLKEYLEHVWAAVSKEALSVIFRDADATGLEPDARLTAMWLWTIGGGTPSTTTGTADPDDGDESPDDDEETPKATGFVLEFDAARKIAQGLGIHLEKSETIVEVKGDKVRLLPVGERTKHLFGKDTSAEPTAGKKARKKPVQRSMFDELDAAEATDNGRADLKGPPPGTTVLDRLHQAMILFGAQRGELLRRFLIEDGVGKDARFWKLAQSLAALYPPGTDERRWVEGVLARKKGLGL